MGHLTPESIQQYLAGEADLMAAETLEEHLLHCQACSDLLTATAADDAALVGALKLDQSEQDWAKSLDLKGAVLKNVTAWHQRPAVWALLTALLLAAGLMLERLTSLFLPLVASEGKVSLVISLGRAALPALWSLLKYLMQGGLIASLWPVLLLSVVLYALLRRTQKKESDPYA